MASVDNLPKHLVRSAGVGLCPESELHSFGQWLPGRKLSPASSMGPQMAGGMYLNGSLMGQGPWQRLLPWNLRWCNIALNAVRPRFFFVEGLKVSIGLQDPVPNLTSSRFGIGIASVERFQFPQRLRHALQKRFDVGIVRRTCDQRLVGMGQIPYSLFDVQPNLKSLQQMPESLINPWDKSRLTEVVWLSWTAPIVNL